MSDRPGPVSTYPLYGSVPAAGRGRKTTRQSCQCIYTHIHIHAYIYLNSVVRLFLFFTFQSIPIAFNRCRCLCAFYCRRFCRRRCLCLHPSVFSFSSPRTLCLPYPAHVSRLRALSANLCWKPSTRRHCQRHNKDTQLKLFTLFTQPPSSPTPPLARRTV